MSAQAKIIEGLRWQAAACARIGSPLYAGLLERAAADVEAGGPCRHVLSGHEGDDPRSMLPLRFMGAVHRLVLDGRVPQLAHAYAKDHVDAWPSFLDVVEDHAAELRVRLEDGVQTNEVSRCAALVGGFLLVAQATGLCPCACSSSEAARGSSCAGTPTATRRTGTHGALPPPRSGSPSPRRPWRSPPP
jgi:hypothetical protein